MTDWDKLAEARIREWLMRPKAERETSRGQLPVPPLELQLLEQITDLYADAAEAPKKEAEALRKKASELETRLLILLESSGRPLAAQRFSELLQELRAKSFGG